MNTYRAIVEYKVTIIAEVDAESSDEARDAINDGNYAEIREVVGDEEIRPGSLELYKENITN